MNPRPQHQPAPREDHGGRWRQVWESRRLDHSDGSTIADLLSVDGYDTSFAAIDETSWIAFVERRAAELGIGAGTTVFEVGCGAGAFLYELHRRGSAVGGIDWADGLVEIARRVMPDGTFEVKDAAHLDPVPPAAVVVSCGVFAYFPSLEYAQRVIELMVAKATHAVAVLDLPDEASEEAALDYRRLTGGGDAEYAARYEGLDHRYYGRTWVADLLRGHALVDVHVADQDLAGYGNAPFRFNAWGFKAAD